MRIERNAWCVWDHARGSTCAGAFLGRQVGNRRDDRTRKRRCANSLLRENDGARWWLNNATVMPPLDFLLNRPTVPEKRITAISRLSRAPSRHRKRYHRSQTPLNYSIKNTLNSLFSRCNAGVAIQILFEKQVFFLTGNELRWISIITFLSFRLIICIINCIIYRRINESFVS